MTHILFHNKKPNPAKLLAYGFTHNGNGHTYTTDIAQGHFCLRVGLSEEGEVHTQVIDKETGDEYILHRAARAAGPFVGMVKADCEAVLGEIAEKCFDSDVFKSEQAKQFINYVREKYGDELEYLWRKFPDNAVVRRKDNQKWYAAILTVSRRKLGFDSDESVEILDLRMKPEDVQRLVDGIKYLPGYHMNKKHWITICLDGAVSCDEIFGRIDASYLLARK